MRHRALTTNVRVFVLNRDAAGRVRVLRAPEHRGSYGDLATSRDRRRVRWRAWRAARVVILRTRRSWFSELANPRTFPARSFAVRLWASAFAFAPSSAPDLDNGAVSPRVRVVHPFHPWSGREFEFVQRRRTWDVDRVFFRVPGARVVSLPAGWTDAVAADPFVVVAAGRAPFRTADLLAAAGLVARLRGGRPGAAASVEAPRPARTSAGPASMRPPSAWCWTRSPRWRSRPRCRSLPSCKPRPTRCAPPTCSGPCTPPTPPADANWPSTWPAGWSPTRWKRTGTRGCVTWPTPKTTTSAPASRRPTRSPTGRSAPWPPTCCPVAQPRHQHERPQAAHPAAHHRRHPAQRR